MGSNESQQEQTNVTVDSIGGNAKLNTEQAAVYLGLHKCTLDRWRLIGKGPAFVRIGRKVFYFSSALSSWLASRIELPEGTNNGNDNGGNTAD